MSRIDELLKKYPKHVARGEYIGTLVDVQPLFHGEEVPIYRFPGGDSIACSVEIANGFNDREAYLNQKKEV